MKLKKQLVLLFTIFVMVIALSGCINQESDKHKIIQTNNMSLIHRETIKPNEKYAESKSDIVSCSVEIYQNIDNTILINAVSNSPFFEQTQYQISHNKPISESDIEIKWTTASGGTEPSKG